MVNECYCKNCLPREDIGNSKKPINIPSVPETAKLPPVKDIEALFEPEEAPHSSGLLGTTVKVKGEYFDKFSGLIKGQFTHGGIKYELEGFADMEATDLICKLWEKPGPDELKWLLKTVLKYVFRFKNFNREKDLLKMATYMYIAWLKMGFHLKESADEDTNRGS